jgi:hypothetical protein
MRKGIIVLLIFACNSFFCLAQDNLSSKKIVVVQKDTVNANLPVNKNSEGSLISNKKQDIEIINDSKEIQPIEKREENNNAVSNKKNQ